MGIVEGRQNQPLADGKYQLMNVQETAELLRLKESTVRNWILRKRIPYVKLGRRVFIRHADVIEIIDMSIVYPSDVPKSGAGP